MRRGPHRPGADVWAALTDFGLPGIVISEEYGGLGLTLLDAALMSEALGRAVAPVPFMGTVLAPWPCGWRGRQSSNPSGCRSSPRAR
uniref:Acyl-CoA dehydrogenase family protein n=1 Tax=Phenylobacterium glaciei TaxID=2803784 RepID=A0A974P706_9CAUL|nr:acyl-CoA dehydrogenase family protein [Phenylobacterium glaciei]